MQFWATTVVFCFCFIRNEEPAKSGGENPLCQNREENKNGVYQNWQGKEIRIGRKNICHCRKWKKKYVRIRSKTNLSKLEGTKCQNEKKKNIGQIGSKKEPSKLGGNQNCRRWKNKTKKQIFIPSSEICCRPPLEPPCQALVPAFGCPGGLG